MEDLNILLIEDNEIDINITKEILFPTIILKTLNVVSTADEAMSYINRWSPFQNIERPELILLNMNLQEGNGFGVLLDIKENPSLCEVPVVILTSSTCAYDKEFALTNGADFYMEKPLDVSRLQAFLLDRNKGSESNGSFLLAS